MSRNSLVWIVVIVAVSVMLVAAPYMARRAGLAKGPTHQPEIKGQQAPEFALESLDGKTIRLSDFRGKAVLVNFWATWCRPCVEELPYFIKADTMLKGENTTFIFVSFDMASRVETVNKFINKQKMPGTHVLVNVTNEMNEFIEKVDPKWEGVIPYTIVLTHEGRKNHDGSFASFRELWGFIRN